jgi:hypothetical protein
MLLTLQNLDLYVRLANAAGLRTATAVMATMKRRKIIALS